MARKRLASIKDKKEINWRGGFSAMRLLPRFFGEVYEAGRVAFIFNVACRLVNALSPIVLLYIGKLLIDEIIVQVGADVADYSKIWLYVGIELGIAVLSDIINRIISLTDGLIGDLYSNASSIKIIRKTKDLSISQLEDSEYYDKLERARTQTSGRVTLMSTALSQVQSLIVIISLIGGLIYFEPWLILILVLSIIPAFINELKFSSTKYSIARSWTAERRELDYLRYIGANDTTAKEMKLFGLVNFVADRFKNLSDTYFLIHKKLAIRSLIIYRAVSGTISIGDLTFLSGSFNRLRNSLQSNFAQFTRIAESALYLKDYFDYIDITPPVSNIKVRPVPLEIKRGFELVDVSFTYPGGEHSVLDRVSFKIKAGEKMAFVGQNGAGKTTLIKLLLRFYEPDSGQILLDGIDITVIRYEFKVRENIAVGDITKLDDREAIEEAARRSLADEVVAEMSMGYDQQLGRRFAKGKNLSGGQWQKIALARAYMKDAKVMVLDEPTSALDARAEYEFVWLIELSYSKMGRF